MHKLLSDVMLFHHTYNQPILAYSQIPAATRVEMRWKLIEEEIKELDAAIAANDIVEAADALVDLLYVINGSILEFGLQAELENSSYDFASFYTSGSPTTPGIPDQARNLGYLKHTFLALQQLVKNEDMPNIINGFITLVEMTLIVAIDFGLKDYFYALHDEVQASNMSKLGEDGKPLYREDGKVLKGPNFFKPDLKKILDKQPQL